MKKTGFLNIAEDNCIFESLDGDTKLNEAMKSFSSIAQAQRINYIKEKLSSIKLSGFGHPIPVTANEVQSQILESSMKKEELILVIEALIESLSETNQPQF